MSFIKIKTDATDYQTLVRTVSESDGNVIQKVIQIQDIDSEWEKSKSLNLRAIADAKAVAKREIYLLTTITVTVALGAFCAGHVTQLWAWFMIILVLFCVWPRT